MKRIITLAATVLMMISCTNTPKTTEFVIPDH